MIRQNMKYKYQKFIFALSWWFTKFFNVVWTLPHALGHRFDLCHRFYGLKLYSYVALILQPSTHCMVGESEKFKLKHVDDEDEPGR